MEWRPGEASSGDLGRLGKTFILATYLQVGTQEFGKFIKATSLGYSGPATQAPGPVPAAPAAAAPGSPPPPARAPPSKAPASPGR